MAIPENGRAVGAAPYSSVMSNYQRPQPNRKFMLVEFPAGTHLDRSRASSGGMRGTARDDRDNSLVAQAELFDADDRYDEGYRDGLSVLSREVGAASAAGGGTAADCVREGLAAPGGELGVRG